MKHSMIQLVILLVLTFTCSCEKMVLTEPSTHKHEVFDDFWNTINDRYAFFELKNIHWDSIYDHYEPLISEEMTDDAFFDTLSEIVDLLKDGHAGVVSTFNDHKYIGFFTCGPENYNGRLIIDHYMNGYGDIKGPIRHCYLANNQIAYLYYGDFSNEITDKDIDYLIEKYKDTKGMIIDVRNNFGGSSGNVYTLTERFVKSETPLFQSITKIGKAHDAFCKPVTTSVAPAEKTYDGQVCILTNRKVFSAASVFSLAMSELPNVTLVGDTTGGGLGLPLGKELSNGWQIHYAGTQILAMNGICYEMGIPPDIQVDMNPEDERRKIDTILERAMRKILNNN